LVVIISKTGAGGFVDRKPPKSGFIGNKVYEDRSPVFELYDIIISTALFNFAVCRFDRFELWEYFGDGSRFTLVDL
jgi:hypothetical protein